MCELIVDKETTQDILLREVLASYQQRYTEISEIWRDLDRKAQGTTAIAGIFIAVIFAFIRQIAVKLTPTESQLLLLSVLFLAVCVFFCLLALRITSVTSSPSGQTIEAMVEDLLALKIEGTDEFRQRVRLFIRDQVLLWREASDSANDAVEKKGRSVFLAQVFLFASVLLVGVMTISLILPIRMEGVS